LGVPVVPTAARQGEGLQELLSAIHDVATGQTVCKPYRIKTESSAIKQALAKLVPQIEAVFPGLPNARWVALRLLDGDERLMQAVRQGELGDLTRPELVALNAQPDLSIQTIPLQVMS
jgi:ferrous iron transport protein B